MNEHSHGSGNKRYKKMEEFILSYYEAYNTNSQNPETMDLMDEYWAPEFVSVQYMPLPENPQMDLTTWKQFLLAVHGQMEEEITHHEMAIDTENLKIVCRLSFAFTNRQTGQLALDVEGLGFYTLKEEDGKYLITKLQLYVADPAAILALFPGPPPA